MDIMEAFADTAPEKHPRPMRPQSDSRANPNHLCSNSSETYRICARA